MRKKSGCSFWLTRYDVPIVVEMSSQNITHRETTLAYASNYVHQFTAKWANFGPREIREMYLTILPMIPHNVKRVTMLNTHHITIS